MVAAEAVAAEAVASAAAVQAAQAAPAAMYPIQPPGMRLSICTAGYTALLADIRC